MYVVTLVVFVVVVVVFSTINPNSMGNRHAHERITHTHESTPESKSSILH